MEKMQINLKECCLTCEHFYLDTSKTGLMGCGPCGPREITCLHAPVCGKYQTTPDTLACKSWGGGVKSSILKSLAALGPEKYNALSDILHELGCCGEKPSVTAYGGATSLCEGRQDA